MVENAKIDSFSAKKVIIDHFDSLINRVDIVFEETLKKYQKAKIFRQFQCFEKFRKI